MLTTLLAISTVLSLVPKRSNHAHYDGHLVHAKHLGASAGYRALEDEDSGQKCTVACVRSHTNSWIWTSGSDGADILKCFADCGSSDKVTWLLEKLFHDETAKKSAHKFWIGAAKQLGCKNRLMMLGCNKSTPPASFFEFSKKGWCLWFRNLRGKDHFQPVIDAINNWNEASLKMKLYSDIGNLYAAKLVVEVVEARMRGDNGWADKLAAGFNSVPNIKSFPLVENMSRIRGISMRKVAGFTEDQVISEFYGDAPSESTHAANWLHASNPALCGDVSGETFGVRSCISRVDEIRKALTCV